MLEKGLHIVGYVIAHVLFLGVNTPEAVTRLWKWTALYLRLVVDGVDNIVARLSRRIGLDMATITEQICHAHKALPYLRHVNIYARRG